jgi:hypothetical protein
MVLNNINRLSAQIAAIGRGDRVVAPSHAAQVTQPDEVTGIEVTAAQDLIAESGVDMSGCPNDALWRPRPSSVY